jgi:glycosyltransferase involved in cell wall biosynthesis
MSEKKKILIFIDWFLPGFKAGGPIRSVSNIVNSLSEFYTFYIITSDRDLGDKKPFKNIELNIEIEKQNYFIIYLTPDKQKFRFYKTLIKKLKPDKIYFNSLFSVKFTILPMLASKKVSFTGSIILTPRGMLGKGALGLKKSKKLIFIQFSKFISLYSGITWHATTFDEKKDIIKSFKSYSNIIVAGNIPEKPKKFHQKEKGSEIRFVFISRISRKKNIIFAIELFKNIYKEAKIIFDIYGPVEDSEYKHTCNEAINNLPKNISVQFKGEVSHKEVTETLKKYHFFLFPTLHENYGHAIFEAFSSSCPVITSDQTPWLNLEEKNIGWDISLKDKEKFQAVIQKCIDMPQEEYNKMSENAFNFAKIFAENSEAIEQTKKLFEL